MITTLTDDVAVHGITVEDGRRAQVLATARGNVAFIYGDDQLAEVTLVIRARCPFNADALDVAPCGCARRKDDELDVVGRAPLGVLVYLNEPTTDAFADVLVALTHLPRVRSVFLPFPNVGDVALLHDATDYALSHVPSRYPRDDAYWPLPRSVPSWRRRVAQTIKINAAVGLALLRGRRGSR